MTNALTQVCLPPIKPKRIGDAVLPRIGRHSVPLPRRHVISVRPCSTISECACHCSGPCRTAADGVRRTPRYDRGIPCGSSRYTGFRTRFARVNPERRLAVSNADRLNVSDKYLSDVERTLLTQSGPKATTIRSASSRKFLAVCTYGSMRTPGLSMPCGSNSRLAALSAAAKSSGRCRSYQDL